MSPHVDDSVTCPLKLAAGAPDWATALSVTVSGSCSLTVVLLGSMVKLHAACSSRSTQSPQMQCSAPGQAPSLMPQRYVPGGGAAHDADSNKKTATLTSALRRRFPPCPASTRARASPWALLCRSCCRTNRERLRRQKRARRG